MSERYLIAESLCLDLQDERLSVAGTPVRLGGRALNLLRVLMERPQVLLTKDELFARVWPGLTLSEAVLTTAVKEIRQAIGDKARQPRFIETAHGRGYRFLLPVRRSDEAGAPRPEPAQAAGRSAGKAAARPGWRAWASIAAGLTLLLAGVGWVAIGRLQGDREPPAKVAAVQPKSLVVLPFEDLSPDGGQQWFADGLAEEVQSSLARAPDLRLVSRTSAANMVREGADGQEVARRLGAAQFLEGSVRRAGDRVRVTVRLVRAADGVELWSHSYDRDVRDVISIQEDIAFQIASSLETVTDPARLRIMVAAGTRSVEAHEAWLRGLAADQRHFQDGDLAYAEEAAEAYERARDLDPQFAAAHWKAAQTWFGNATRIDSPIRENVPDAERLARYVERVDAAIATASNETDKLKYQAGRASMGLQFRPAHRLMAQYLAARPRDIDAWEDMADLSAYVGERAWMRRAAERIHALSLEEGNPRSRAITVSVMALDLDAAVRRAREQLALRPDHAITQYQAHRAMIWAGRTAEAAALLPRIEASQLPQETRDLASMRQACAEGRTADAAVLRGRIEREGDLNNRWLAAQLAGDYAAARELLRPLDRPDGLATLMQYLISPTFDSGGFPLLAAQLNRNGVPQTRAIAVPHGCRVVA